MHSYQTKKDSCNNISAFQDVKAQWQLLCFDKEMTTKRRKFLKINLILYFVSSKKTKKVVKGTTSYLITLTVPQENSQFWWDK